MQDLLCTIIIFYIFYVHRTMQMEARFPNKITDYRFTDLQIYKFTYVKKKKKNTES